MIIHLSHPYTGKYSCFAGQAGSRGWTQLLSGPALVAQAKGDAAAYLLRVRLKISVTVVFESVSK